MDGASLTDSVMAFQMTGDIIMIIIIIIIRQFVRCRNMSVDTTRAPYRKKMGTRFATAQL